MITIDKVLAYIFRENNGVIELLVFDHQNFSDVNPQVIAGTVKSDEDLKAAVLREIYEESGLELLNASTYHGCFNHLRSDLNEIHKRHIFSFHAENLPDKWEHKVSDGEHDKGLLFDFYWIPVEEARIRLVADMGSYLPKYIFKPLMESNFHVIESWLKKPHVKEFWDDGETWQESYEKYVRRTSSNIVEQFIIYYLDKPLGYIQFYWAHKVGNGWWENVPDDVVGIDQYIGEEEFLGQGHGTNMIKCFVELLFNNYKISKIITDPSPNNLRAIKCYEKVGFKNINVIETPDGLANLMEYLK